MPYFCQNPSFKNYISEEGVGDRPLGKKFALFCLPRRQEKSARKVAKSGPTDKKSGPTDKKGDPTDKKFLF